MKGLKYFAEYSDFDGQEYKIEIWVEGFTGVATEVTAGGNPVTVDRNKDVSETYLGGIVPTFYRFEFVTDTNFSTRVFDSEKYGDVVIQHYKGTNLQFNAIVQPFVGMEQDLPDGLSVFTLSGECGLEYLKNKKFANPTNTNVRLIDLIQEAVDLIPYVEKFGFKVFDNTALYNGVSRINSNQNFLEARINRKTFTDYTYYDVLLNLVANRNEIYFDNGFWWVRNLSELSELYTTSNTGTLVTYDENGDFLTSIPNYRPSKSIIRQAGGSFGKLFSQKNVVVKRIEPERINYVLNGSFDQGSTNFVPNNWTAGSEAFSSVLGADFFRFVESVYTPTLTSDNAYIQSTAITWEPFGALFASPVREPQKLTFRANVEIGTGISACRFQIIATSGSTTVYLTTDLAWTTTPTIIQKKPEANGQIEFDISQPPNNLFTTIGNFDQPISYNVSMRLFRSERAFETTVGTATYFTQYNEVSFFKDSLYTQFFDEYIGKSDYRQDENSDRENPLELETIIASQNSFPYRHGSLFDAEGVAANGFGSVNSVAGSIYNIYLATSYLNVTSKRLTYYQGSSFEHFDFSDVLLIDGIHFRVSNYSHDIKSKTVQFKAVELNYSSGFELDINKIKSDVEKAITVVNNIGLIPQDYNFTSSTNFDGRTSFGMRPDVRHVSASLTEMFLRATPTATDSVSIKPGATGIELLTPPPLATTPETLATREWAANGLETKYLQLDTTYTNGNFPGRLSWDGDHDLMFLGLEDNYTAKVPQDAVWSCIAAEAITKGQLVYASGTVGSSGKIQASRFIANGTIPSRFVIGVATRTVAQGETFHALRAGVLRGLDTSTYTAGQDLWASSTVAGGFQTTAPAAPNPKMAVAFVITSHAQVGELAVRIIPSLSVSLLDDVQVTLPATNQLLRYNNNRWENFTPDFASVPTSGTVNRLAKFTAGNALGDSLLRENGTLAVGIDPISSRNLWLQSNITGGSDAGVLYIGGVIQSDVTTSGFGVRTFMQLGTGDTLPIYTHFNATQSSTLNRTLTTQVGFQANSNLAHGTNNYGFRGLLVAGTNRWNLYMDGTAINYLRGALLLNRTVSTGEQLQVTGTAVITGNTAINGTLTVPTIGNSAGVSAQNTWTFASNVNVPLTPSASTHATSKSYVDNLVATGIKEGIPVRSISLTNITLSGTQTVSGVSLVAGDRVLVAGQTTASQNGVYIVASGAWTRATDSDTDAELRGYQYLITAGTFINAKYRNTNEMAIVVGVTAITYVVSQGAETDPIFSASPAAGITQQFINNWNANYAVWGELTPESIFANRTTSNLPEGTNLYYTDARARAAISAGTGISYNSSTGVISSLITQYTDAMARAALSFAAGSAGYNSTTGVISIPTTSSHITEGTNLFYTDTRSRAALSFVAGSGAYNSGTGVITIPTQTSHLTNNSGFITSSALSDYVPTTRTINGLDLSVNRVLTTSNIGEGTNLYFTDARSRASLSFIAGSGAYNSTTGAITIPTNTDHVAEAGNLYYTDARSRSAISVGAGLSYNSGTGVITNTITQYTDTLARLSLSFVAGVGNYSSVSGVITIPTLTTHIEEGTRQYFTDARARAAISVGTGLSYNSETGVMSNLITQYTDTLARLSLSFVSGVSSYNNATGVFTLPTNTNHIAEGSNLYYTDARARAAISLTTSGTSGAATYNSSTGVLNIPNYTIINPITGVLTAGRIPVATAAGVLGNSNIFQDGVNVGIGTTTPASLLDIAASSANAIVRITRTNINSGAFVGAYTFGDSEGYKSAITTRYLVGDTTQANMIFHLGTANASPYSVTERMRLTAAGELLIGTTISTNERLQVNGSAKITSMAAGASTDELVTVNASGVLRKIAYTTFVPSTRTINGLDLSANRTLTTTNIEEGTSLYFTNARARAALSFASGVAGYNSTTGLISIPTTSSHITEGTNLFYTDTRSRAALSFAAGTGAYNSTTGVITIPTQTSHLTNNSGFITSSALSGYVPITRTINGLDLSENRILTTSNISEGSNLYYTDARTRTAISFAAGSGAYNSTTGVITIPTNTNHLAEGLNLYFTNARARGAISAGTGISYNNSTGVITNTITQYTDSLARAALSFTAGSANYNSTTGVITIPTTTSHITEGTNLYHTTTRVRTALSFVAGAAGYNSSTGVITIPTQTSHLTNNSGFITSAALSDYVPTTRTINGLDLSVNRVLTTSNIGEGTNLYFTNARARSAISLTVGTTLTAPTYNASTGVLNLPATLLQDRQFTDVAAGLRLLRSIDYYESRMDFGFDKVLDVPYLYYDKNGTRYVNYMNGDGVFVHVDGTGNERQYLRVGDIGTTVPNLQQVSEVGKSSTIKLQWNGVDYATVNDIVAATVPTLQQVSQQGSNSTIRLSFNGQNYATLADLQTITVPTPTLSSVLASGNNAFGTPILFGSNAFLQGIEGSLFVENTGSIFIRANSNNSRINLDNFGALMISGASFVRCDPAANSVQIAGLLTKFKIDLTANVDGVPYAFHQVPGTLTAGAKYVFLWDGNKFIITNA